LLYSIHNDLNTYAAIGFNWKQIVSMFGENMDTRFDVNHAPRKYSAIWKEPLQVTFSNTGGLTGTAIPDIAEHQGRLFLSTRAYDTLHNLLKNDGEFLPVEYENGTGYMFNPLRLADTVGGLNEEHCVKNEWDDVEHIAFHEDKLDGIVAFRSEFDFFINLFCQSALKQAVEQANLKGVTFTSNLGNTSGLPTNGPH
jgi:hypothetical protein|tara:strand:+ start:1252 stop:1842 length:591 start_codon:yes stop_codon:yes gene_type:complete